MFIFLPHHRNALFDDAFQEELAALYAPSLRGQLPIPPAQLARASIVQAYTGLIRAVGITPANVAEASVTEAGSCDLEQQSICLKELHIDRAYLSSHLVRKRSDELEIYCKAWPVREGKHFSKQAFTLDWERQIVRCPAEQEMPFVPGGVVHFPQEVCAKCPLKAQCTASSRVTKRQYSS